VATSNTVIANLAISHLGSGKEVTALDTENSDEANACRRFYEEARKKILRDFNWPFATKIETLVLLETTPNNEWAYSYRYPTDCLNIRKIQSGVANETNQSRAAYKIGKDTSGKLIFSNTASAIVEYTEDVSTVELFDPDFVMAFSFLLASYTAARITGGDPFKLGDRAMANYQAALGNARANAVNEEQPDQVVESEFIRGRE
jgi:hypothetical protein